MTKQPLHTSPAQLTIRVNASEELLVRHLYGLLPGTVRAPFRPDRLVVDAHVPLSSNGARLPALDDLAPDEVALAASKVHMETNPADRIAELLMLVGNLASTYPMVTTWQQGLLGEACVIQGAAGYECGIGWRDKCDLQSRKSQYRSPGSGHPGARPIYIRELGRGVPKRRLELARTKRKTWARLVCPFPDCCAPAGDDLLGDARKHSVVARARELAQLDATRRVRRGAIRRTA